MGVIWSRNVKSFAYKAPRGPKGGRNTNLKQERDPKENHKLMGQKESSTRNAKGGARTATWGSHN